MPDFGLTEALEAALKATKGVEVMRPGEAQLAKQAQKTAPAAVAPSVQTPSATPTGVQAPPLNPSVPPPDLPAPPPTQTPVAPAPSDAPPSAAAAPPPPGALAASQEPVQSPAPPPLPTSTVAPANRLPPGIPAPVQPAAPAPVQQAAQRFVSANMGDFAGKLDMTHMPNPDTMGSPDAVKAAILQVADDNKGAIEAARGQAATEAQLIGMAQDLSISADTLQQTFDREFGTVADTAAGDQRRAIVTAARMVEQSTAGNLFGLADRVMRGEATSAELVQWEQQQQALVNWRTRLAGAAAESGRDLNVLGMQVGSGLPPEVMGHIADIIKRNNPDIQATAAAIKMAGTPAGISSILNGMATQPLWKRIPQALGYMQLRIFVNGILSGPPTWKTIFLGNTTNLLLNGADLFTAGIGRGIYGFAARAAGFPTAEEGIQLSDAMAYMHGVIHAGNDALRVSGRVLKTGVTLENLSSKQISRAGEGLPPGEHTLQAMLPETQGISYLGAIVRGLDLGIDTPGRVISGIDQFIQTLGYRGWAIMRTYQELRARTTAGTLKPGDAEQIMLDMLKNPSPDLQQEATAWGARQTFQTPYAPGGPGEKFQAFLNKAPALRIIFPFMRTATDIVFKQGLAERTPLAVFSARVRSELAAGGVTGDLAKARLANSTAVLAAAAWWAIHDRLTGPAPKDPKERGEWELDGRTPMSFRWTNPLTGEDTWRSYAPFEPLATIVGATADIVNIHAYLASEDDAYSMVDHENKLTEARNLLFASVATNAGNKSFMQGAAQFSEFYNDPKRAADMWLNEVGAAMVPYSGMTRFIRNEQDPYLRDALTLIDKIKDDLPTIPGVVKGSRTLMPRLDVFGEPRPRLGGNSILGPLNPLPGSSSKKDDLTDEIQSLMEQTRVVPITMPTKLLALDGTGKGMQGGGGMRLTPEEYYDYVRFSRADPVFNQGTQTFRERLQETMNMPAYKAASPPQRVEMLGAVERSADQLGAIKLYHENTDFRERMTAWTAEANRLKLNR